MHLVRGKCSRTAKYSARLDEAVCDPRRFAIFEGQEEMLEL